MLCIGDKLFIHGREVGDVICLDGTEACWIRKSNGHTERWNVRTDELTEYPGVISVERSTEAFKRAHAIHKTLDRKGFINCTVSELLVLSDAWEEANQPSIVHTIRAWAEKIAVGQLFSALRGNDPFHSTWDVVETVRLAKRSNEYFSNTVDCLPDLHDNYRS